MSDETREKVTPSVASAHASKRVQQDARDHEAGHDDGADDGDPDQRSNGFWGLIGLLLFAAGAGIFAWLTFTGDEQQAQSGPQPPLVRVATAVQAERLEVRQTGFVRPLFEVDIATEVAGRIVELGPDFRLGVRISEGEALLRLDPETFQADLELANARLEQARATVTEARIARNRAEELEDSGFATEERLQEAILGVAQAEANLASARAEITRAQSALSDTTVTAPFDAIVTARTAAPGQIVQPGRSVGTLIAQEAAEIEMGLAPPDIALLGDLEDLVGAKVEVRGLGPDALQLAEGVVTEIDPRIEEQTRTTVLVVRIDDPFSPRDPRPLRVNELVELVLPARLPEGAVLSLPATALTDRDTVWAVEDSMLRRLQVKVLQRNEDRVLLLSDALEEGEQVMVSDMAAAFDGQAVRVSDGDGSTRTGS